MKLDGASAVNIMSQSGVVSGKAFLWVTSGDSGVSFKMIGWPTSVRSSSGLLFSHLAVWYLEGGKARLHATGRELSLVDFMRSPRSVLILRLFILSATLRINFIYLRLILGEDARQAGFSGVGDRVRGALFFSYRHEVVGQLSKCFFLRYGSNSLVPPYQLVSMRVYSRDLITGPRSFGWWPFVQPTWGRS